MFLPFEIWVKISSYLTRYEDIINFESVSRLHKKAATIGVINLILDGNNRFYGDCPIINCYNNVTDEEYYDIKLSYKNKNNKDVIIPSYRWILQHRNFIRVDYPFLLYRLSNDLIKLPGKDINPLKYKNNYYDLKIIFNSLPNITTGNFFFYDNPCGSMESLYYYNNNSFNLNFNIFIGYLSRKPQNFIKFNDYNIHICANWCTKYMGLDYLVNWITEKSNVKTLDITIINPIDLDSQSIYDHFLENKIPIRNINIMSKLFPSEEYIKNFNLLYPKIKIIKHEENIFDITDVLM